MAVTPRGIRNANPGNLRKSQAAWQGKIVGTDPDFETFDTPFNGIRALAKQLIINQESHGLKTVRGQINRWAPPVENNTSAYVAVVARALGVDQDAPINVRSISTLRAMTTAIIDHENGQPPPGGWYASNLIGAAIADALGFVVKDEQPAAPIEDKSPPKEVRMDPLSLVSLLVSVFAPKIRAQADKVLGTDVGAPLINNLLGMAQQLTGKTDPLEAVAVARQDPAIVAKMEATTEDWFKQIAPAVDKIAALEKQEWDASEASMSSASDRGFRMQEAGPLKNNPQFLIALGILSMVAIVVMSVLWKDAVIALFIGKEALGAAGVGFSTDMQAFVIGAIVGSALTAVIAYFFGSTRSSAAKDVTISAMANQAKGGKA